MADDRWRCGARRCAALSFIVVCACSRERAVATPDASTPVVDAAPQNVEDTAREDVQPVTLDDRCKRHDDCVAIGLYPDGDLRCCLACIPQRAANKTSADAFIAMCARERAMRECPVYDCAAPTLDPRCVGGHCMLAPRAK